MDLGAYVQIEDLSEIAKKNGIEIPRLRGYRLMKNEDRLSQSKIDEIKRGAEIEVAKNLCRSDPFWNPNSHLFSLNTWIDYLVSYYVEGNKIRWDRIHGKKRKILKFEIKKQNRKIQKTFDAWNKYAGREDVLYIHSRMGGWNWKDYDGKAEIMSQPWFLDRVDDYFDSTYCDFYAKIES